VKQGGKMRWVLAQNIENSLQMAVMVDIDGNKIVFYTQHEADIYIELNEENPEDILVIPEMEFL
jgi:hypothetical protein